MTESVTYITTRDTVAAFSGERCIFSIGSRQRSFTSQEEYLPLLHAAAYWKQPATSQDVQNHLEALGYSRHSSAWAVNYLIDNHHVVDSDALRPQSRYSRHELYFSRWSQDPDEVQDRLAGSHVVILGCGGIGNHVATHLATAGVGKLTLVDDDIIEESNLTRQHMFTEENVGQRKTAVLAEALRVRNSSICVSVLPMKVDCAQRLEALPPCDLIIASADTPRELITWVNSYAVQSRTAYINVGYAGDIAVFGPFYIPGRTGCFACQKIVPDMRVAQEHLQQLCQKINTNFQAPSYGPINAIASAMAVNDAVRFLGGFADPLSLNQRVGIHSASLRIETQNCTRNPECSVCGK